MSVLLNNAIRYVHSLMQKENIVVVMIDSSVKNTINVHKALEWDPDLKLTELNQNYNMDARLHNPISAMIEKLLSEICTDCIKVDYYFADPFFCSLVSAYLEVLINQYGECVPINRTMAQAILGHSLTKHSVCFKDKDGLLLRVGSKDDIQFEDETQAFFLKVNNENN